MAITFDHIHLRCEDLDGAVSYYENVFDGKVLETADVGGLKSRPYGNRRRTHILLL